MEGKVLESFWLLKNYVESENFKGWDPYDGLSSKLFQALPFRNNSFVRLAWIQLFKRNPFNFRGLVGIEKTYNSKGLGLFLSGYCNLYNLDPKEEYHQKIQFLIREIEGSASSNYSGACWGYYFDWQARAFFQPRNTPTVVATTYVAYALMDAYEVLKEERLLRIARSSCDFVLKDLNKTYDQVGDFCFSYSPLDKTQVFNASLLGSRLLARVYSYTKEAELFEAAKKSISFCCKYQQDNGAWSYGTLPFHQWIDNFHTGFNLECIHEFQKFTGDESFKSYLNKGLDYYLRNFFTGNGESKYYNNSLYPIDIHGPAQLIITLCKLEKQKENEALIERVLTWTIQNMQDKRGYFYYQIKKRFSSRIPYMRWAQAWMFFSLSLYIKSMKRI